MLAVARLAPALGVALTLCLPPPVFAAHPLITEDTGTQGRGNFQFELTTESIRIRETGLRQHNALTAAILTYGFVETADVLVTAPFLRLGQPDSSHGPADIGFDIKWRFYETGPVSFALKPGVTFPTGNDDRNLGAGRMTWSLYQVTTVDLKPWAFHLHLGHHHNNNTFSERVDIWHISAAVTWLVHEKLKLVLDAGQNTPTETGATSDPAFVIGGLIWSPRSNFDIDLGIRTERSDTQRALAGLAGITFRW